MSVKQLPSSTRKLITCSQVITSASSVVKELVENAVDAGAMNIYVKLENSGLGKIEVKDDGCGINCCDMINVCLPSYTSKIVEFSDLESLSSYGFRGEALSALCQVADVTITTRTSDDEYAMSYSLDKNGMVTGSKLSHHGVGCHVVVSNLFRNLPVRKQYLNSGRRVSEELKRVESIVKSLAVIHPAKKITFCHNKCLIWQKHATSTLKQSLMQALGCSVSVKLEELNFHKKDLNIQILIPEKECVTLMTHASVDSIMVFVNKRPVRNKKLEKMMIKHIGSYFEGQLAPHRYPHCLLSIETLPSEFDINLEPNKSRVLFKEEDKILTNVEKLLSAYYISDTTDETISKIGDSFKESVTTISKHKLGDEVGSCAGGRPQKKARVQSITSTDDVSGVEHPADDIVQEEINGINYQIHIEETVPESSIKKDSIHFHEETTPSHNTNLKTSEFNRAVGNSSTNVDPNLKVESEFVEDIALRETDVFSFRNELLDDDKLTRTDTTTMPVFDKNDELNNINDLAFDKLNTDTVIDDFINLTEQDRHTGYEVSNDDEFHLENDTSRCRNIDSAHSKSLEISVLPEVTATVQLTPCVTEEEWAKIDKATEKWSTHNYVNEPETDNEDSVFPNNRLRDKEANNLNVSVIDINQERTNLNDLKKQSCYNSEVSGSKRLWSDDGKESEKWSSCKYLNENLIEDSSSNNAGTRHSLDIARQKWSTGCMTTVDGHTLQGSSVLLPSAPVQKYSPVSSGDRSVCSQMGQKEDSALTKFSREVRPQILAENPGIPFTTVAGMIVDRWRSLNEEQKVHYKEMAKEVDKERQNKRNNITTANTCLPNKEPIQKENKAKTGKFQKLLNDFVTITPCSAKTKTRAPIRPGRKRQEIDISLSILKEKLCHQQCLEECLFEPIGQLKPSNTWLYRQGKEIGVVRHWGLQETILFHKLMKDNSVPIQLLDKIIILDKRDFEPDLWDLLLSLDKAYNGITNTVTIVSHAIVKNGFLIELREDDGMATCSLNGIASTVRFYGVPELKETLQLIKKHGIDCSLDQCRPPKIRHYLMGDAVRMAREAPSLDRESLDELLDYWHNNIRSDEYKCLHHKPIFMPL